MAQNLALFFTIFLISLLSHTSPSLSSDDLSNSIVNYWCSKTPNPSNCLHYARNHHFQNGAVPRTASQFKKFVLNIAMDQSLKAQNHNKWLGSKLGSKLQKAAWRDCLALYQDTIYLLNQTLDSAAPSTGYDVQTWLSAALTNLDTCRTGFVELGLAGGFDSVSNRNISEIISNVLALNKGASAKPESTRGYKSGFPAWVSPGDRKLLQTAAPKPDVVVAKDGTGKYRSVKEALDEASRRSDGSKRFVIYVKAGVYNENLEIGKSLKNIMMYSDSMRYTVITGSKSVGGGSTTFNSATVAVTGEGFIARGITFRNTAGPENHQAVALRSGADLSVFYRCGFEGYQDTLYVHSQRQFYKECYIYGTVDFIFGNAAVVFQNCMIYARRPMAQQKNTITAQGRTDPNQNTGISIHDSRVMAAADLVPVLGSFQTFLGRPWKEYSRTVFMQTYLDTLVDPAGWLEWSGNFALDTLYYGEYKNLGPRASTSGRVKWRGFHVMTSASEAAPFTVENFIAGRSWLPGTGVPFYAGL
ncbi:pectinesterase 2-like [Senna tora]|uniref:Pectinesterase n=1 Tax=Senna tora TaxID=362788 RepID=A0A834X1K8_9FABA|nr:pectinesterase 2-like [Senna tora]KAF7836369.1 pectinesterase 2-like [Senna tora]